MLRAIADEIDFDQRVIAGNMPLTVRWSTWNVSITLAVGRKIFEAIMRLMHQWLQDEKHSLRREIATN